MPFGVRGEDVGQGEPERGVPEVAQVAEVDDAEDPRRGVPLPGELLVGEVEAPLPGLVAPEVELAPVEVDDGRQALQVERRGLEVGAPLDEKVVGAQLALQDRDERPGRHGARDGRIGEDEGREEAEPRRHRSPGRAVPSRRAGGRGASRPGPGGGSRAPRRRGSPWRRRPRSPLRSRAASPAPKA